ncbi:MAG: [protein-PII] uridylyltransferase [Methylovulum sp.]|uniref:[protein-PII] uridylyltransferase n=1 Tax=Methylovulum sp. TaxID=1916980 RepID=UPI00261A0B7D|nr:[protein-PII] uridylyltransferase [Methylovulum sp.]MDD2723504.1 [protein-PII] uridylyltransferase [Methylovulum sp.]MDD5124546.1 [protein-PII] uridylyltransferase [Methylovulum sp.]
MALYSELFDTADSLQQFKLLLKQKDADLKQKFDPQSSVYPLIKERSDFIDELLGCGWQHFLGNYAPQLSLIAVGGYGRRELFPYSDIDIVVLLDSNETSAYQETLADFFTFLWDIGLKPGQSVRTIAECVEEAGKDQTIMTSLMEIRLITGCPDLFETLKRQTSPDHIWPSDLFFQAKMIEQRQRHAKAHHTAYNLEPNIKEGPGGLRDMQVIAWVFKRHYHSSTLKELIKYGFMPESEYNELMAAREVLWRIRYALHLLTQRGEDRLIFDYQRDLAQQFGFSGEDRQYNQDVERFMQFYYKTVQGLERLNEMLLQLFNERFICGETGCKPIDISDDFVAINGYLEAVDEEVFTRNPLLLIEIFIILQKNTTLKGIRATTIRLIRKNLHLMDDSFRRNNAANHLFIDLLRQPRGITTQLRRMNRYGVLAAYLPAFANIVARMQYDLFHIYTVDEHTLFVIRNLRRFSIDEHYDELPFCHNVFLLIPKPELLYLAALFHDIAKGRNGDHSAVGEEIALQFCAQHKLSNHDSRLIAWLVRNHLIMSMTAQRKDISDADVIHEFAQGVGSVEYLNYLYLLTVADIRATNPELWNSWKDVLLKDLYNKTHSVLRKGLQNPVTLTERLLENKKEAREELLHAGFCENTIDATWQNLSDDYFLRYAADEIAWHTRTIATSTDDDLPLVLLEPQTQRGSAEVFVYTRNIGPIFSLCTATFDQLGLTILDARIMTTLNDYILNSFQVLEQSGEPILDHCREDHIRAALQNNLRQQQIKSHKNIHRQSRQARHFPIPTSIQFHDDPLGRHTIIELVTTDRAGLLSQIGQAFIRQNINLHSAKITTIGSRAEDMFYVTDQQNQPITDPYRQQQIHDEMLNMLDAEQ